MKKDYASVGKSVTSHLKDLLSKMGGSPKDGDSTSILIDKIEDLYAGGKGRNGSLVLHLVRYEDPTYGSSTRVDKTVREIIDAFKNKKNVYLSYGEREPSQVMTAKDGTNMIFHCSSSVEVRMLYKVPYAIDGQPVQLYCMNFAFSAQAARQNIGNNMNWDATKYYYPWADRFAIPDDLDGYMFAPDQQS